MLGFVGEEVKPSPNDYHFPFGLRVVVMWGGLNHYIINVAFSWIWVGWQMAKTCPFVLTKQVISKHLYKKKQYNVGGWRISLAP